MWTFENCCHVIDKLNPIVTGDVLRLLPTIRFDVLRVARALGHKQDRTLSTNLKMCLLPNW